MDKHSAPSNAVSYRALASNAANRAKYRALSVSQSSTKPAATPTVTLPIKDKGNPVILLPGGQRLGQPFKSIQTRYDTSIPDTIPMLVIRVEFAHANEATTAKCDEQYWFDAVFGSGNSVTSYYNEISNGQFTYVPAVEASGMANNGVVSVTLPFEHPGAMLDDKPVTLKGTDGESYELVNSTYLPAYALMYADEYVDFSQYDRDGDKLISPQELAIFCIISGLEMSSGAQRENAVWAHSWEFNDGENYFSLDLDGVGTYKYVLMGKTSISLLLDP